MTKEQDIMELSTTEVEYMTTTHASKQALYGYRDCVQKQGLNRNQ